jgi:hypothetical protein
MNIGNATFRTTLAASVRLRFLAAALRRAGNAGRC